VQQISSLLDDLVEQTNFDSYKMLRMNEAPVIEVHIIKSASRRWHGRGREIGDRPAIANAIYAATGKRLRKMPVNTTALK
jgi:isoquinoline 1-oxidoreductase beta subunit